MDLIEDSGLGHELKGYLSSNFTQVCLRHVSFW
jgi:hypothetical protein